MSSQDENTSINLDSTVEEDPSAHTSSPGDMEAESIHIEIEEIHSLDDFAGCKKIGEGGSGEVYQGVDPVTGRRVAIKTLKPTKSIDKESAQKLLREAKTTAQLEHPNIVPVHTIVQLDDRGVSFTMKLVTGETLSDILQSCLRDTRVSERAFSRARLLDIFIGICQGISFAHSKGVIHRDLKPDNIIIGRFGEVLILDWGLAKEVDTKGDTYSFDVQVSKINVTNKHITRTIDGMIKGTPSHMSPEQACARNEEVDKRSDIYSLGVILYNMLTLAMPFNAEDLSSLLDAIVVGDFIPPRKKSPEQKIPKDLEAICLKAMSLSPDERYQDVKEIIADIEAHKQNKTVSVYKDNYLMRFWKTCLRNPVVSVTSFTVFTVLLLVVTIIATKKHAAYSTTIKTAEAYIQKANDEYAQTQYIINRLARVQKNKVVKNISIEEIRLQKQLRTSYVKVRTNYSLALNLLGGIQDRLNEDSRISHDIGTIFKTLLHHASTLDDEENITFLGNFIINFVQTRFETMSPELEHNLQKVRALIRGEHTIVFENVGVYKIELWALDPELGKEQKRIELPPKEKNSIYVVLEKGSYLLKKYKDDTIFRYPFIVSRSLSKEKSRVDISLPSKIYPGFVYIPAGDFIRGGEYSRLFRRHTAYLDSFFIQKTEVSFEDFRHFWLSLDPIEQKKYTPMIKYKAELITDKHHEQLHKLKRIPVEHNGSKIPVWDKGGRYILSGIAETPVRGITYEASLRYCKWFSKQNKVNAHLPTAAMWEKAARGCDGRRYPWGNWAEKERAIVAKKIPLLMPKIVGTNKRDVSIYGVYDMAGNVREFTYSVFPDNPQQIQVKGASFESGFRLAPCAAESHTGDFDDEGFRMVISKTIKKEQK